MGGRSQAVGREAVGHFQTQMAYLNLLRRQDQKAFLVFSRKLFDNTGAATEKALVEVSLPASWNQQKALSDTA